MRRLKHRITYGAFAHAAVLPSALAHSVDVNKVVMGTDGQEVSIWRNKGVTAQSGILRYGDTASVVFLLEVLMVSPGEYLMVEIISFPSV